MEWKLLADNLTNPSLLFFCLGLLAVQLKSDLKIPANSSKFITLYLLFSIGFRGGQELSHSVIETEVIWTLVVAILLSLIIPIYCFFIVKKKLGVENAGAIAAAYGSVSAALSPEDGNRLLLTVLAASASYIAVPAAMKLAAPKANAGLYVPMALAITFPMNIIFGIPWYLYVIHQLPFWF